MAYDVVLTSVVDGIATVTLNRPGKRNAMDNIVVQELIGAIEQFREDNSVNIILINANGEHFCAGADIQWMQIAAQNAPKENVQDAMLLATLLQMIYHCPKPIIALVHGTTLGGGLGLVAACDIAIAATNSVFAFSEVKVGITPSVISPYVIAAIGERTARYYFLTAQRFNADEAHRIGLVHQSVEPEALNSVGLSLAKELLNNSPNALAEAKILIHKVTSEKLSDELIRFTAEHLAKMRTTPEGREGLSAFIEKRTPQW